MTQRWLVAARPATLPLAITPVLVGCALAEHTGAFRWDAFVVTLLAAMAIQVGVNMANDAADAARGADAPDRVGPPRAVATGLLTARQAWAGAWSSFGVAALAGLYLAFIAGWVIIAIGSASILAALGYTSGPAYGYRALGELAVFVFFGIAATVGSRYVHDQSAPADAWLLAVPVGLLITAVLVANNVRDLDTDAAAGKRTLAVVLGSRRSRTFYIILIWAAFGFTALIVASGAVPRWTGLGLAAAPAAIPLMGAIAGPEDERLIGVLPGTVQVTAAYGLLVAAGAVVS